MAKRARTRNKGENPALEMTPMIDVVFQLLIFFIVCVKQEDILARLNAARPAGESQPSTENPLFLDIEISKEWVLFMKNSTAVDMRKPNYNFSMLDNLLAQQARFGTSATVTVRCALNSNHGVLMHVLDLLAKHKFTNINIFSI